MIRLLGFDERASGVLGLCVALTVGAPAQALVPVEPVVSPGGLSAWLVEERSIPMVALEVIFPGGAALDAHEALGATALMAALLTQGAGALDAKAFAEALEETAGQIRFETGRDSVSLSIKALSDNLDEVIELARLALLEPRFDPADVERIRAQTLAALERDARNPAVIAAQTLAALGFREHPYGRPADGTPETVRRLDREAIRAAHARAIHRAPVYVGAAGDIDAVRLGALLDRLLGDLPNKPPPSPAFASFSAEPGVRVVAHPGPQAFIAFGHGGIARDDPDFLTAFVLNELFGGSRFSTRLTRVLREERALTYGVGTGLSAGPHGDSFQGRLSTDNARAAEAIEQIRQEWRWLAEGRFSDAELEETKRYLTGAYPLRFDGNAAIAGILASMQFQGFPIDYVNIRNDLIRAITPEEARRVAARLVRPQDLVFVVVGRPEGLSSTGPVAAE